MVLSMCSNPSTMEVMGKILLFIDIIKVVVPIILIIILMLKFAKAVSSHDANELQKSLKSAVSSCIAATLIFLVPTSVELVAKLSSGDLSYQDCLIRYSPEEIKLAYYKEADKLIALAEESTNRADLSNAYAYLDNIKDETKKAELTGRLEEVRLIIEDREAEEEKNRPHGGGGGGGSTYEGDQEIVETAKKYIGKNVGTDCSGFVKHLVLKPLNYLQDDIAKAAASCDGRARGSNGMYKKYLEKGRAVWERPSSDQNLAQSMETFPGDCKPGDIIFYSYGANDCVKHVVVYVGYENGQHMIVDSNMQDNIVRYRAVDGIYRTAMPLACIRPIKNGE